MHDLQHIHTYIVMPSLASSKSCYAIASPLVRAPLAALPHRLVFDNCLSLFALILPAPSLPLSPLIPPPSPTVHESVGLL